MKCNLCTLLSTLRKRGGAPLCIADRAEVDAKFRWWRDAQLDDRYLIRGGPQREAISAAGELEKSDPKAALSQFLALAEGGSVWSMLHVGVAYGRNTYGERNFVEAERWLRRAVEHGSQRARLYLANTYVMQSNFEACEKILQPCVAERLAPAMYILGIAKLQQRPKMAKRWEEARVLLEDASALSDLGAQWALSRRMARGWFGWQYIWRGFQLMSDAVEKTEALMDNAVKINA